MDTDQCNFSMDARIVEIIAENLKHGHYLEVFVHKDDLLNAVDKNGWDSILSLGWLEWSTPYVIVKGAKNDESVALCKEIISIFDCKGLEIEVIDSLI